MVSVVVDKEVGRLQEPVVDIVSIFLCARGVETYDLPNTIGKPSPSSLIGA